MTLILLIELQIYSRVLHGSGCMYPSRNHILQLKTTQNPPELDKKGL